MAVLMYVRFPLSLRNVEDLLFERGIDICHETVRQWWNRFGPIFAADIRRQRHCQTNGAALANLACGRYRLADAPQVESQAGQSVQTLQLLA